MDIKQDEFVQDFEKSGLRDNNLWDQVQDFDWIKQEKSPNFELIYEGQDDVEQENPNDQEEDEL